MKMNPILCATILLAPITAQATGRIDKALIEDIESSIATLEVTTQELRAQLNELIIISKEVSNG